MSSPQLIALDDLIKPISAENAVGSDVRIDTSHSSTYSRLRDARKTARAAERSNLFDGHNNAGDEHWRVVLELSPAILAAEAKDLEVASWYTEALVRKSGFRGLRDGFRLIRSMIEEYWDELYPTPDEDGLATRVAALTGLNGEGAEGVLIVPMRDVAITDRIEPGPFNYWQYKQALDAQRVTDDDARAEINNKNGFGLDDIQHAVELSSQEFYVHLRDDVRDALEEYKTISSLLDERCGIHDSPPTSNIINTLDEILGAITHIARNKLPQEMVETETSPDETDESTSSSSAAPTINQAVKTRDDAFRQLAQISQFFRQTEPHSPISYVIDKALKWGNMPLEELIKELIPDSSSRDTYSSLTGVKTTED